MHLLLSDDSSLLRTTRRLFQAVIRWYNRTVETGASNLPDSSAEPSILEKKLGHILRTKSLLTLALTHKSRIGSEDSKGLMSNERLEQ